MGDVWCCRVRKFSVLNGENKRPAGSARVVDPGSVTGMKGGEEVGEGGNFWREMWVPFIVFRVSFFVSQGGSLGVGVVIDVLVYNLTQGSFLQEQICF